MNKSNIGQPSIVVRPSVAGDVAEIQALYAYYVLSADGTFEEFPPSVAEMGRRRGEVERQNMPFWVAASDGNILGFAYAGPYHIRAAYRFTAQVSVYVHGDHHHRGIGRSLLREVVAECTAAGFRQMLALIGGSANVGPIRLFTRSGFRYCGQQIGVGYKFGRWLDVVMMQRSLANNISEPVIARIMPMVPIP